MAYKKKKSPRWGPFPKQTRKPESRWMGNFLPRSIPGGHLKRWGGVCKPTLIALEYPPSPRDSEGWHVAVEIPESSIFHFFPARSSGKILGIAGIIFLPSNRLLRSPRHLIPNIFKINGFFPVLRWQGFGIVFASKFFRIPGLTCFGKKVYCSSLGAGLPISY